MTLKIAISNPCSEVWSQMNPTNLGAYCAKCQIEVIDFSEMEPEQIRMVLTNRKGRKTCANIATFQMELINTNYHLWDTQSPAIFRSKFLYACMLVFGIGLFSACDIRNETHLIEDVSSIEIEEVDSNKTSSNKKNNGGYTLSTMLGRLDETDNHSNNYDAYGNYSVTTRLKDKLVGNE